MKSIVFAALALGTAIGASANDYLDRSAWKWSSSSICAADGGDITGLEGIYDGDASTCWHSNYHAAADSPERANPHWVMIDRTASDTNEIYGLSYMPRLSTQNATCTHYAIYLSDASFEGTPADSYESITAALGEPDYQGYWDTTYGEKVCNFDKPTSARYVLWVNVESANSRSAACAEMNLLAAKGSGGGGGGTTPTTYNALKITPRQGEPHRIAIDDSKLTVYMDGTNVRLGNSAITVEYAMDSVLSFVPEIYKFAEGSLYTGDKKDINTETGLPGTALPTFGLALNGGQLCLSGVAPDAVVTIYNLSGVPVASGRASAQGEATLAVGGLSRGAYLLSAPGFSTKIIL